MNKITEVSTGKGYVTTVEDVQRALQIPTRTSTIQLVETPRKSGSEWCTCGKSESAGVTFYDDGQHPSVKKHHYRCNACNGIVQIG